MATSNGFDNVSNTASEAAKLVTESTTLSESTCFIFAIALFALAIPFTSSTANMTIPIIAVNATAPEANIAAPTPVKQIPPSTPIRTPILVIVIVIIPRVFKHCIKSISMFVSSPITLTIPYVINVMPANARTPERSCVSLIFESKNTAVLITATYPTVIAANSSEANANPSLLSSMVPPISNVAADIAVNTPNATAAGMVVLESMDATSLNANDIPTTNIPNNNANSNADVPNPGIIINAPPIISVAADNPTRT